jgi:hypothetical protein
MHRPATIARLAGLLYLALAVLGGWAELYVRGSLYVPGDGAATTANITGHETLFRLGLVADILMATVFVFLGVTLYRLLHRAHERAATTLMVFVAGGAASILVNSTFHAGALVVATEPAYAAALGAQSADALVLMLLDLHRYGYILGGVFFGLWLLPMGLLARRSAMFPSWLGVLLIIGCFAWIADPVIAFALPDAPGLVRGVVSIPTSLAEFGLMLYLLIRGVRPLHEPAVRVPIAA